MDYLTHIMDYLSKSIADPTNKYLPHLWCILVESFIVIGVRAGGAGEAAPPPPVVGENKSSRGKSDIKPFIYMPYYTSDVF